MQQDNRKTGPPNIWLPPGFRFHPTDDELITFYLVKKVVNNKFGAHAIAEVDLNKYEPWDLPEKANMGEKEWYFFSLRDRKYPTGMRTNRATEAGYWKATGKDRDVRGSNMSGHHNSLVGMKKTLVFYKGRAPRGEKTNWVMHEYRLEGKNAYLYGSRTSKEEWVVCRIFQKRVLAAKLKLGNTPGDEDGHDSDVPSSPVTATTNEQPVVCKQEFDRNSSELNTDASCNEHISCITTGYNCTGSSGDHHHHMNLRSDPNMIWNPKGLPGAIYNSGAELARLLDPEFLPALNSHFPRSAGSSGGCNHKSVQLNVDGFSFKPALTTKSCKSEPHHNHALLTGDSSLSYSKVMEASLGLLGEGFLFENQQPGGQQQQQQQQQVNAPDQGLLNELLFSRFLSDPSSTSSEFDQLYAF